MAEQHVSEQGTTRTASSTQPPARGRSRSRSRSRQRVIALTNLLPDISPGYPGFILVLDHTTAKSDTDHMLFTGAHNHLQHVLQLTNAEYSVEDIMEYDESTHVHHADVHMCIRQLYKVLGQRDRTHMQLVKAPDGAVAIGMGRNLRTRRRAAKLSLAVMLALLADLQRQAVELDRNFRDLLQRVDSQDFEVDYNCDQGLRDQCARHMR